jgi:hypothetical protein
MVSDIRNDTSGDYKRILTEICNKCLWDIILFI